MWRLYFLVERCYKLREPVLLVGETGGGKTTVCQLLSIILGSKLHILNCHQYTETSDFLGVSLLCPVSLFFLLIAILVFVGHGRFYHPIYCHCLCISCLSFFLYISYKNGCLLIS